MAEPSLGWRLHTGCPTIIIGPGSTCPVALCYHTADAALILKALAAHKALVSACRRAYATLNGQISGAGAASSARLALVEALEKAGERI